MATAWTSKNLKTTPTKARRSVSMGLSSALILTLHALRCRAERRRWCNRMRALPAPGS